jgi:hypothetical protein
VSVALINASFIFAGRKQKYHELSLALNYFTCLQIPTDASLHNTVSAVSSAVTFSPAFLDKFLDRVPFTRIRFL